MTILILLKLDLDEFTGTGDRSAYLGIKQYTNRLSGILFFS